MGCSKAVLRGKFIPIQAYLKKQEKSQINNLTLHIKELEKEEQTKPKVSRRKEIIKIRSEISEKEMRETIVKILKTKSWLRGFPGGAVVENLPANAGDTGSSPGLGRSHMLRSS